MATTGTYNFNPSLGELVLYAYGILQVRRTELVQQHMVDARLAANFIFSRWSNQGVNLWAVDLQTVPLVAGTATYTVPTNTVVMLDAYLSITNSGAVGPTDRLILPVSRTEYASYPNKSQQGFTTVFWMDRLLAPTVTLWLVPDGVSAQYLKYYRVRQIQDAELAGGLTVEIPYLWLEAFSDALAHRLSRIYAPQRSMELKNDAAESYKIAADQNVETANQYVLPQMGGYFRP